jgi:hypothetical protein
MLNSEFFNFENKHLDFPFYKKNPYVPKIGWIILFLSMIIALLAEGIIDNELVSGILFCLIPLITISYYLKWDYKRIFQRPSANDIILAVALFIGYIIYALIMGYALDLLSLSGSALVNENSVTFITILSLFPSLMGEELIKFIPLIFFLRIIYKYTENRKLSIILSMFIVMMFFALLHLSDLHSIVSVIVLQGFGTIFEFYGYLKTKNIFISYLTHLLTDLSLFIIMLIGL